MQFSPSDSIPFQQLRTELGGHVVTAADDAYDETRAVVYGGFDRRPAFIVRAADATDVARVVSFARESGLELAVRGGGHSLAGHSISEGGIVLDLRALDSLDIDVENRTAWAGAGLTAGAFTSAAAAHGLAVGFGDAGSVGIGGITLGGGVGYLVRKHGLTVDALLAAEIVTADGQLLHIDADTHPDLFWAIRGGGGNFGVATRLRFRLQELGGFVGGMMILPATAETVAGFVAAAAAAPEELSAIATVMPAPPMPFLPAEIHGQTIIFAMLAHAGDEAAGVRAMAPFRALATPLADMVKPMPYPDMFPPEEHGAGPTVVVRTLFVDAVDPAMAETIMSRLATGSGMRAVQLRVLGGAAGRVPADATAYAHRDRAIMVNVAAFYDGPQDLPVRRAWIADLAMALQPGDPAAYVNFIGDEGAERVRAAYPGATWERLRGIKARYDPTNLFRLNQNIPPAV